MLTNRPTATVETAVKETAPQAPALSPFAEYVPEVRIPHLWVKRTLDILVSALALLALAPFMAIIALLIRLESPGPVLFRQIRLGRYGKPFIMYKFRSMRCNAQELQPLLMHMNEKQGGAFKIRHDPRMTRIGRFLRKYSLDELPQLFNVLKGDLSLVGPRAMAPYDVNRFDDVSYYRRFAVPQGCTGLWQVSGRSNLTFEEWMRLDLYYVDHISFWLDIKILLKTIPAILKGDGAY
ncbi:MAG: exopolysaccharide biosynthesis polyprenyl glycosylphosphotransferase [Fimbriimonadales bacterium]|nr:exopolysaccharide biosynthesis polyprenyl glycosylphosphotransferase [Fimbriimonadales bacterium]